ncbi:VWA domain-containing protein [Bythopirellula goksoeyrii]|uniref:von Willebrand factor type A domain protein n=1 Tax=Bythopirellula goksoeyrii TaxID=1400387 RepID=A0A5B9QUV2_9BACT|nr:VWA domain-containing protein [Bythopirellula goksoeyrii]QEG37713.1 von Willebrand factor type A domain protein [Bythopirellula goksoeyrii]
MTQTNNRQLVVSGSSQQLVTKAGSSHISRNPNYDEPELDYGGGGQPLVLKGRRPKPLPKGPRRKCVGHRSAAEGRKQLVIFAVDDSASMKRFEKCLAALEAMVETLYQMVLKGNGVSVFDVAIFKYGDKVFAVQENLLVPVDEVDEDTFVFQGNSGGTKIKLAMGFVEDLLVTYDQDVLAHNEDPERVPPPLVVLISDGYNGDGNPRPVAARIKEMPLSIGVSPIIATVGIEYGGGEPHVELMTDIASKDERGKPLYFDIQNAGELADVLATLGSSAATSATTLYQATKNQEKGANQ